MAFTKINAAGIGTTETVTVDGLTVINNESIGGNLTVTGNATISGVLTYEDVTNVDSVGLITARNGVVVGSGITLSKDGDIFATGVTTSTTFSGNFSGGTVSGTTGTFSSDVKSTAGIVDIRSGSSINTNVTGASASGTLQKNTTSGEFAVVSGGTGGNNYLTFYTSASAAPTEKLRIASDGDVIIGGSSAAGYADYADNLTIHDTENSGITIRSGIASQGAIYFSDATGSGGGTYIGNIIYDHSDNHMRFATSGSERVRITGIGSVGVGINDPVAQFQVNSTKNAETDRHSSANYHLALRNPADDNGESIGLSFGITSNATKVGASILHERDSGGSQGSLQFYTSSDGNSLSERLRITSAGLVGIGTASPDSLLHIFGATTGYAKIETGDGGTNPIVMHENPDRIWHTGLRGDTSDGYVIRDATASANRITIDTSGNTHFGSGSLNDSNVVSIIPADGRISFGMDGRDSLVTGESGCYIFSGDGASGSPLAGELVLQSRSNVDRDIFFATGSSPAFRARFRGSDGDFFLGNDLATITNVGTAIRENDSGGNTYMEMGHDNTGANYSYFICRHGSGGTNIGGIAQNSSGNGVTFNTSSDYRLKTNEASITDGITKIKQLKPYRFEWKSDLGTKVDGFFAHEVSSIVPEAITGEKDAVETTYYEEEKNLPEGKSVGDVKETNRPVYQSIDQSKLVPLLTAALQEAIAKIETLETKVAALESS